jgi:hypothetical protein
MMVYLEPSEEVLRRWAPKLRFFRYVKALGGHNNDPNEIVLVLSYAGEDDLTRLFDELGILYRRHLTKPPQPEAGKSYLVKEFAEFPSLIPGTHWIQQPVWQTIDSVTVSVWAESNTVKFTVVGPRERHWMITETEFENVERLERIFEKYSERVIDPPVDWKNCICPKYYPHYWEAG